MGQQKVKFETDVFTKDFMKVFKEELSLINNRRKTRGIPEVKAKGAGPHADNGLIGLAFSGGGIRSASVCLGAAQHLIRSGYLKFIDYISTVSGGGYTGSCISSMMDGGKDAEKLLLNNPGKGDESGLGHIRNTCSYLNVEGFLGKLTLPGIVLKGVLQSFVLVLPLIIFAVFLTEAFFESYHYIVFETDFNKYKLIIVWGVVTLLTAVLLVSSTLHAGTREKRIGRLSRQTIIIASILAVLLLFPILTLVEVFISGDEDVFSGIFMAILLGLAILMVIFTRLKALKALAMPVANFLGPFFLIVLYFWLCTMYIDSPYYEIKSNSLRVLLSDIENQKTELENRKTELENKLKIEMQGEFKEIRKIKHFPGFELEELIVDIQSLTATFKRKKAEDKWYNVPKWATTLFKPALTFKFSKSKSDDSYFIIIEQLRMFAGNSEWWLYILGLLLFLLNFIVFKNVNIMSHHPFYRDRLSRTFLIKPSSNDAEMESADELLFSAMAKNDRGGPLHIVNTTLNLSGSGADSLRERCADNFILSPAYCGSSVTGYMRTEDYEKLDKNVNLGTAMAISAAAASPIMGTMKTGYLSILMVLLNIRLDYWLPNPGYEPKKARLPWMRYLWPLAFGNLNAELPLVNCSDGGHFENLAIYELLRRRCKYIVAIDAEADPHLNFGGFATMMRYARIDMGIEIEADLTPIRPDRNGYSEKNWVIAKIHYDKSKNGQIGHLLYIKASMIKDENEDIKAYRAGNGDFPHQSTADQFFDEAQFEAYRALGENMMRRFFKDNENGVIKGAFHRRASPDPL